jgi:hypothetical protein
MANHLYPGERSIFRRLYLLLIFIFTLILLSFSQLKAQNPVLLEKYLLEEGMENTVYLQSLVYDNIPSIIISSDGIKEVKAGYPQKATVDASALGAISQANDIFRTVKLLQINIASEQDKAGLRLRPEMFNNFFNLYYILINSSVPLSQGEVSAMVSGFEEGQYIILFSVNSIM